jgi:hypothetical protein
MRRSFALLGFLSVVATAAASFMVIPSHAVRAASDTEHATFLIPASDGYGTGECLAFNQECGRVVANAWCESQGYGRASAFGLATNDSLTGSVPTTVAVQRQERPISITCTE